jgi:hypothetical protein
VGENLSSRIQPPITDIVNVAHCSGWQKKYCGDVENLPLSCAAILIAQKKEGWYYRPK